MPVIQGAKLLENTGCWQGIFCKLGSKVDNWQVHLAQYLAPATGARCTKMTGVPLVTTGPSSDVKNPGFLVDWSCRLL